MKRILGLILSFIFIFSLLIYDVQGASIYYGASANQVMPIQEKLKRWDYYDGEIDGTYGKETEQAVRLFQEKNGLSVDGKCGKKTLEKMGLPESLISSGSTLGVGGYENVSDKDFELLARCITGEARGEPYIGQVAVAAVILNRVESSEFPNSISGVIYQNGAFTAVSDGQINLTPTQSCINAAKDALAGWDPSGDSLYYYNPVTATSEWIRTRPIVLEIGAHVFCH